MLQLIRLRREIEVSQGNLVKRTLNADRTLTPNTSGSVEVKGLVGGKKYSFIEKAHTARYEDVTEYTV